LKIWARQEVLVLPLHHTPMSRNQKSKLKVKQGN